MVVKLLGIFRKLHLKLLALSSIVYDAWVMPLLINKWQLASAPLSLIIYGIFIKRMAIIHETIDVGDGKKNLYCSFWKVEIIST